jgi:hypothetical protein
MAARRKSTRRKSAAPPRSARVRANAKARAKAKAKAKSPAAPSIAARAARVGAAGGDSGVGPRRKLIIVPHAGLDAVASPAAMAAVAPALGVRAAALRGVRGLSALLQRARATVEPLFGEAQLMPAVASMAVAAPAPANAPPAELGKYQVVKAPDERLEDLANELIQRDLVAAAYVQPEIYPPLAPRSFAARAGSRAGSRFALRRAKPRKPSAPGAATQDFSGQQGYLAASPDGVDAHWAWSQPGGRGDGVSIIDIEGGWCFTHEDLRHTVGGLVGGTALDGPLWRDHGTAVLSEIAGEENGVGVTGIVPRARLTAVSHWPDGAASAILTAARRLRAGDVILMEMHAPGPRLAFQSDPGQRGFIAMEWWPDVFAAVSFAVRRGILVVSAAGNGAEDLDDPLYSVRPTTPPNVFDPSWVNPFDRTRRDSGSIIVGAGAPPSNAFGLDRSRLGFSNFGALVDAQGWGAGVVGCGYGDLQNGVEERLYTATFSGTSSASPIVVGALASLQGMRKAAGRPPLTPAEARALLRAAGAPQTNGGQPVTERIGNRPDIRAMAARMPG